MKDVLRFFGYLAGTVAVAALVSIYIDKDLTDSNSQEIHIVSGDNLYAKFIRYS